MKHPPKVQSSAIVYEGFFNVKRDILQRHDGSSGPYTSLVMPTPAAIILAQNEEGLWILNKEYRHPTGQIVLGCCGGRLEPGEDALKGAQRELFEETGYWTDQIRLLGSCYQCPAITDQIIFYCFAENARLTGSQSLDPLEYIEPCLMTDKELEQEIAKQTPVDASLFTALWLWKSFRDNN